ncbi:hypothetical protein M5G07_12725 [Serratia symbiotica]|nr:hypothetical protein [Serratia symbiotica]
MSKLDAEITSIESKLANAGFRGARAGSGGC